MRGTVLYDSECTLCNSQVRFLREHDRLNSFRFVALQSEEGMEMLRKAGLPEHELDTVVYERAGRQYIRSSAVLNILRDLGRGWRLLYAFVIVPGVMRDFFYKLVACNRHRLYPRHRKTISRRHAL